MPRRVGRPVKPLATSIPTICFRPLTATSASLHPDSQVQWSDLARLVGSRRCDHPPLYRRLPCFDLSGRRHGRQ